MENKLQELENRIGKVVGELADLIGDRVEMPEQPHFFGVVVELEHLKRDLSVMVKNDLHPVKVIVGRPIKRGVV